MDKKLFVFVLNELKKHGATISPTSSCISCPLETICNCSENMDSVCTSVINYSYICAEDDKQEELLKMAELLIDMGVAHE